MNTIGKDELYRTVSDFMKSKGIKLTDGAYAEHIRRGCGLLSDAINAAQRTVTRAREEVDKKLLHLRQCIHEATAPPTPPPPAATAAPAAGKPSARAAKQPQVRRRTAVPRRRPRRPKPSSQTQGS